jgi:ribosomal protein L24
LVKDFDSYSVSSLPVYISSDLHFLFINSKHPIILKAKFPPPVEWSFSTGEHVNIIEGPHKGKLGHINLVLPEYLDVEISTGEGLVRLPWHNIYKHFAIGDFVKVVGGMHEGKTGWVQGITDCTVSIVQLEDATVNNSPVVEVFIFTV